MGEEIITVRNYYGGRFADSDASVYLPVVNPGTGAQIGLVPLSSAADVEAAVISARAAYPAWSALPIKERALVLYRYRTLLERDAPSLAQAVHEENGKILSEALAEVEKSIEVTEFACSMPQIAAGEILEVSRGVECRLDRYPVGIVASITPFNFPIMVPNWTIPNSLVLGNAVVLKPSEQVPLSSLRIAELLKEAGLPDGVFNVVHGGQAAVESLCDHPGIDALTFVGSSRVARLVYARATAHFKRALCLGGAKNHLIVLPDAHTEMTASNVAASMTGCAGQRCMAAAVLVAVGPVDHIIEKLCAAARNIVPGRDLGAVISRQAKERIEAYVTEAAAQGAEVLVDGRNCVVPGREGGFYVGPTIIDRVRPEMRIAQEEVFGPVLAIIRTDNIEEALQVENSSPYGNAASVFTQSGGMARLVMERASAGMMGVNVGVPVPREPFSFGGWNESKFGVGDITGKSSIEFFTRPKKTTIKWNPESRTNWMS